MRSILPAIVPLLCLGCEAPSTAPAAMEVAPAHLHEAPSPDPLAPLLEELSSDDIHVRVAAAGRLKELGHAALERAARHGDPEVSARAVRVLAVLRTSSSLSPALLKAAPGIEERLTGGDDHAWSEELFRLAAEEEDRGKAGRPARVLKRDLQALASRAARGAFGSGERRRLCEIVQAWELTAAGRDLILYLQDEDSEVRDQALCALWELDFFEAAPEIVELLRDSHSSDAMIPYLALHHLRDRSSVPQLRVLVNVAEGSIRRSAVDLLGELGDLADVPLLMPLLHDDSEGVRAAAARAVASLGAREAIPELVRMLKDPEGVARGGAAIALGVLQARETIPQVLPVLSDDVPLLRESAALALAYLGAREAVPALEALLEDKDKGVRSAAVFALAELGETGVISRLTEQFRSGSLTNRWRAIELLARLGAREAIPDLLDLLEEDREEVDGIPLECWHRCSFEALEMLSALEVAPRIARFLRQPGRPQRPGAAVWLCRMGFVDGIGIVLEESREYNSLNALRHPAAWARLGGRALPMDLEGTTLDVVEAIARHAGLQVEWSDACFEEHETWTWKPQWVRPRLRRVSLRECLETVAGGRFQFVLESDRIRILSRDEALAFWRGWWARDPGTGVARGPNHR